MKIKQYIVTYNDSFELNECLKSIFDNLSEDELNMLDINIINNHTNLEISPEYLDKINLLHNTLRPDFSTGHLSRNWNQAIINGFKNLLSPDADMVITNQNDTRFCKNYINNLIEQHKKYDLISLGDGDNFVSYTVNAVKKIGLWDERFCNIGYQEADYFLRAVIYHSKFVSINDYFHNRIHNPTRNNIIVEYPSGYNRGTKIHKDSKKYHQISHNIFTKKWNINPELWRIYNLSKLEPLISSFIYYPYFEKDVETLKEQKYMI
jgi:hypothetical protein